MSQEVSRFQKQGRVKTIQGSILTPHHAGLRLVLNVNNMAGKTDDPIYKVFDKKWPRVKTEAKGWYNTRTGAHKLGAVLTTATQSDTWVIHLLVQDDKLQTDVESIKTALKEVYKTAKSEQASVHVSTMTTKTVPELNALLTSELVEKGISVSFYDEGLPEGKAVSQSEETVAPISSPTVSAAPTVVKAAPAKKSPKKSFSRAE